MTPEVLSFSFLEVPACGYFGTKNSDSNLLMSAASRDSDDIYVGLLPFRYFVALHGGGFSESLCRCALFSWHIVIV